MSYRGPRDDERRRAWVQARRDAVRLHHPDAGGDPVRLQEGLAEIDRRFAADQGPAVSLTQAPPWQPATRLLRRCRRTVRRGVRTARSRLPNDWPGARRYFDL